MAFRVRTFSKAFLAFVIFSMITIVVFYQSPLKTLVIDRNIISAIYLVPVSSSVPVCSGEQNVSRRVTDPFNSIEVHAVGNILERIRIFNSEMENIRNSVWTARGGNETPWKFEPILHPRRVVGGADDEFLLQLSNFTQVTTVVLPWVACGKQQQVTTEADSSNFLIKDYYIWSATEPLCSFIASKIPINNLKYNMIYREDCNKNLSSEVIEQARPLPRVFLNSINGNRVRLYVKSGNTRSTEWDFYGKTPPNTFFAHIIHDAIITDIGDVFTHNLKLVPFGCTDDRSPNLPDSALKLPLYDEVFSITQYWGGAVFHRMIEIMPRVAVYLDLLNRNPQIRILAPEGNGGRLSELFRILGLDPRRLITGWVRARVVYLPRPSMCGMGNVPEIQILSSLYRRYIVEHLTAGSSGAFSQESLNLQFKPLQQLQSSIGGKTWAPDNEVKSLPRNKLVLIRRTGSRRFTEQTQIEAIMEKAATDFNLTYEMFRDNPTPSLNETMLLFHSAVMIVAPHGAGLSNVVFCQPGTYVIEGVCNPRHINLCFHRATILLGHHWHGIPSRGGCEGVIDVNATIVDITVRTYLRGRTRN